VESVKKPRITPFNEIGGKIKNLNPLKIICYHGGIMDKNINEKLEALLICYWAGVRQPADQLLNKKHSCLFFRRQFLRLAGSGRCTS
jgi:hypothetical protein